MTAPGLIPLLCIQCQNPILAQPDEVAWVCSTCGQGMLLDEAKGLQPLAFHFSAGLAAGTAGKPVWVVEAAVTLRRSTYQGNESSQSAAFWAAPRRFFVPAYTLPLETLVGYGLQALKQNPPLQEGAPGTFIPVTIPPGDVRPLVEFIVTAIEAERKDMLRELAFEVAPGEPQLWILP